MRAALRGFLAAEGGAGTAMSILLLMICALLGGLVIDINNAWRHKELLKTTADVAVHAGVVELARGGGAEAARAGALAALDFNTPLSSYGRIIGDATTDVVPLHYDAATNLLSQDGAVNAVAVTVQRSEAVGNPVPTYLMRLVGRPGWDITSQAVAALVPTRRCNSADGIYAQGEVLLGQPVHLGAGVCVHSQDRAVLSLGNSYDPGAVLSMPDLARCGAACAPGGAPGVEAAAVEANLILAEPAPFIDRIAAEFTDPNATSPEERAFFASRPRAEDLSALDEVGVPIEGLVTGSLVTLTPLEFSRLRALPAGLVYQVMCPAGQGPEGELILTGGPMALAPVDGEGGEGGEGEAAPEAVEEEGLVFRDLALVTDCALRLAPTARIEGALIVTTRTSRAATLIGEAGARVGDAQGRCGAERRTTVLSRGDVALFPGTLGVNVGMMTPANLWIGAGQGETFAAQGVALHAGGMVGLAAPHAFSACAEPAGPFEPELLMIRHVLPGMEAPEGQTPGGAPAGGGGAGGGTAMSRRGYGS